MYIVGGVKQMKEFITALDPNYQLDKYHIKNNVDVFYISSKMNEVKCPYCGTISSKVHSFYEREIQDLPMQNRKVIFLVKTVFYISSKMNEVKCPYCGTISSKVHSFYEREIQDLPMQNRKVIFLVKT